MCQCVAESLGKGFRTSEDQQHLALELGVLARDGFETALEDVDRRLDFALEAQRPTLLERERRPLSGRQVRTPGTQLSHDRQALVIVPLFSQSGGLAEPCVYIRCSVEHLAVERQCRRISASHLFELRTPQWELQSLILCSGSFPGQLERLVKVRDRLVVREQTLRSLRPTDEVCVRLVGVLAEVEVTRQQLDRSVVGAVERLRECRLAGVPLARRCRSLQPLRKHNDVTEEP